MSYTMLYTSVIYAKYKCLDCGSMEYQIVANGGRWPLTSAKREDRIVLDRMTVWSANHTPNPKELHRMELVSIFIPDENFPTTLYIEDLRKHLEREQVILESDG